MTDEKDEKWEMPKPVFRSSTGQLPKSLEQTISGYVPPPAGSFPADDDDDEDDILSVLTPAPDAAPLRSEKPIVDTAPVSHSENEPETEESPAAVSPIKVTAAKVKPAKRRGFGSFVLIFLLIAVLAAGIVLGLMYYLSQYRPVDTGTF